ncbi:hypothetical protein RHSIM_Rhsim09G0133300 [Rhododendron simsii]|uniref:Transcriptional regulator ATRX n=1 Tax=Rhododendron simsii TaxID=118357 RepID=A0A834GIP8_RHOSS|nr:hypothetical protein RHSIM_Rhsim09G0133300 [Rhododendron simsii]
MVNLTEEEIEELISELLEVESKAAEAQESLEDESLEKVEDDVRQELAQSLQGEDLEKAVSDEMETFREDWEAVLDGLEKESAHLLEQLDGAGVELPSLFKWIESQAPNGCSTEAWRKRTHWVGSQVTNDVTEFVSDAEKFLQSNRPIRRKHGKILEEGASGYLGKKLCIDDSKEATTEKSDVDWSSFNQIISARSSEELTSFGSKNWASVYFASTPQQAAELGLKFPGVDEVEEIDDIDGSNCDPLVADALANEREAGLSEAQKKNFKKVKEEDDANFDLKLQRNLNRRRQRYRCKQEAIEREFSPADKQTEISSDADLDVDSESNKIEMMGQNLRTGVHENIEVSDDHEKGKSKTNGSSSVCSDSALPDESEPRGTKRSHDSEELEVDNKKTRPFVIDIDDTAHTPLKSLNGIFHCTVCDKLAPEVLPHPLLKVIVCRDCKCFIEEKMHLQRNLGEECLLKVQLSGWQCCCCSPSVLQQLTLQLEKAIGSVAPMISSSDSDSDSSDADITVSISTKRKRKKKIRRILDDAELGEETKKKIAIEKERQDRLKSMEAQVKSKSVLMSSMNCSGNLSEGCSVEVLGDALTGYIVNVVREKGEEPVRIPPSMSGKLKGHQVAGIRFMWENIIQSITKAKSGDKGLGCILAHTMGLGKTFQVIAFLYSAMRSVDLGLKTALIVTPVTVLHNWRNEFSKWSPLELKPLRVFMLGDVSRERRAEYFAKWRAKGGVFLIGYSAFRNLSLGKHLKDSHVAREICYALQDGPDILVCDEAHTIKNTKADVTQALKQVKCQRRIALTGSPLQNNLMEYYCMVDFVREGFLGSSHDFQNPIENGQHTNSTSEDVKIMNQRSHILYEQLKGFVQRMDMNVVKKDLPPKTVFVIAVKLSPLQRKLYRRCLDVHGNVSGEKLPKRSFFAGYQALAQIWNHPGVLLLMKGCKDYGKREDAVENLLPDDSSSDENIDCNMVTGEKLRKNEFQQRKTNTGSFDEDWWSDLLQEKNHKEVEHGGKMVLLLDILTMSSNVGDKTLVFSQSLSTLDMIEHFLSKLPRQGKIGKCWRRQKDWYRLDGRMEASERQKLVERFNEPSNKRVKCTLISTKAGSLGINLYAANRVIIVDGAWNPTYDLQAIFRAWRYGQTKPVFAYRLMAQGTMEEKIYKRQVTKEGLAARVVDRQQVYRTMSKEEMLHLFDFSDDESDSLPELVEENGHSIKQSTGGQVGIFQKQKLPLPDGTCSSDKFMEGLLSRHYPRWIANYHEHESLLQENEDEKLSKEEQDMAWDVYRRTLQWEEVPRVPLDESAVERKQDVPNVPTPPAPDTINKTILPKGRLRNRAVQRKCTNLAHLLTLRSQGTKTGCSTVCGECAQEISWENLNRDGKSVR